MKRTFFRFALMSIFAATIFACDKDKDKDDDSAPAPTVTDVTPTEVAVGDEITITGTDLDKVTAVAFGLSEANFTLVPKTNFVSGTKTSIKVIIPAGVTFPSGVAVVVGVTPVPWMGGMLTSKASQAQMDALAFLMCANGAFTAYPDETSAEYQQAVGACLANNLTIAGLSFDSEGNPNNDYTNELFDAITETVTAMYVGQTPEAIAASIAGIHYMIY
ncbi:MAG: IPT/TIG domain-containing protein, partial [Tannerella sp.]|nr:IPT/TIG domain-containing protein [Tannerella sp.]